MSPRRAFLVEWLMVLFMAVLLMGCTPQTPVEEAAVATHVVAPRPELTPATLPALTGTPLSTPTATIRPVLTETPPLITPTPPATPTIPPAPTNPPPATPLPPVPVFAGLLRHDLQLHLGDEPSTLSYLTGVGSDTHLNALRDVVAANWGDTRILEEQPYIQFSPDRQLMAFLIGHPIPDDGLGGGRPPVETVVMNSSGQLVGQAYSGTIFDWLPGGAGYIADTMNQPYLYFLDGRTPIPYEIYHMQSPSISPDGNSVAYIESVGGSPTQLWHMNLDGSDPTVILSLPDSEIDTLTWSPDGNWLAYFVDGYLWFLELAAGNTKATNVFGTPVWSPDSRQLAVYPRNVPRHDVPIIHFVDPMSGQVHQLSVNFPEGAILGEHTPYLSSLTWSPDGAWLGFLLTQYPNDRTQSIKGGVWAMDTSGTVLYQLTDDEAKKDALRWTP